MKQNEKKTPRKISPVRVLVAALGGLMAGLCVYGMIAALAGNTMPMPFGMGAGVVLSGSMEPELRINDLIIIRSAEDYQVGDVVVYQSGGMSVVHRIVSAEGGSVTTKGDANNTADKPISPSDIRGRVVGRLPGGGVAVDFLRSPVGVILILGAAILLLELSFRAEKRQGDREIEAIKAEITRLRERGGTGEETDRTN